MNPLKTRHMPVSGKRVLLLAALCLSPLQVPAQDSWPTYHGNYNGQRHSQLGQITQDNVHTLTLAWAFQTNQTQQIKGTPILVDGIMYVTVTDNLWAIDARTGRQLWRHRNPDNTAFHIGHTRRGDCWQSRVPHHARRLPGGSGQIQWPGSSLKSGNRGSHARVLVYQCAAADTQSSDSGCIR